MQTSKRILFAALIVFCLAIFYFSCASIIHGTKQSITINSTPTQAVFEVKTEGGAIVFHGYTPATVSLDRKNAYDVTIYLDGYQPEVCTFLKISIRYFWAIYCLAALLEWLSIMLRARCINYRQKRSI